MINTKTVLIVLGIYLGMAATPAMAFGPVLPGNDPTSHAKPDADGAIDLNKNPRAGCTQSNPFFFNANDQGRLFKYTLDRPCNEFRFSYNTQQGVPGIDIVGKRNSIPGGPEDLAQLDKIVEETYFEPSGRGPYCTDKTKPDWKTACRCMRHPTNDSWYEPGRYIKITVLRMLDAKPGTYYFWMRYSARDSVHTKMAQRYPNQAFGCPGVGYFRCDSKPRGQLYMGDICPAGSSNESDFFHAAKSWQITPKSVSPTPIPDLNKQKEGGSP